MTFYVIFFAPLVKCYHYQICVNIRKKNSILNLNKFKHFRFFENVKIDIFPQRNIKIPGTFKAFLDELSLSITKKFEKDKTSFFQHQRKEHIEELLHSDHERQRRKELVLAQLRMRCET